MSEQDPEQALKDLWPKKDFFVGIDSDSCALDTYLTENPPWEK
ncbi:MAG: hypothetical protein ACYSWP_06490 [Planctomycetota bacterium]|jgi:hypothetical protein